MKKSLQKNKLLMISAIVIIASICSTCEGDDSNEVVGVEGILENLNIANLDTTNGGWDHALESIRTSANGYSKRWDFESQLIPVQLNGSQTAVEALDIIEGKLGIIIFDRTSLDGVSDDLITRGIIVSEGNSIPPYNGPVDSTTCGGVSMFPDSTNYDFGHYDATGEISARLYLRIGSSGCSVKLSIAIHEFGHAMGLQNHFSGFGIGPPIDNNFWNALSNLYKTPIGTYKDSLVITKDF